MSRSLFPGAKAMPLRASVPCNGIRERKETTILREAERQRLPVRLSESQSFLVGSLLPWE
jgi:hypothetical protein